MTVKRTHVEPAVAEKLEWSKVSRLGVNVPALAGKPGASKRVLGYEVLMPDGTEWSVVGPVLGQWALNVATDTGTKMAEKYEVGTHCALDFRKWHSETPLVGAPSFYRDEFENTRCTFKLAGGYRVAFRAEPVAFALRQADRAKRPGELHVVTVSFQLPARSACILAFYSEPALLKGDLLAVVPASLSNAST